MALNKLMLNDRARRHIKIFPVEDDLFDNIPSDEGEKIKWCEKEFKRLQNSNDAKRLFLDKHKGKGYLVSVWSLDGRYYLIQDIRNEFKTFNSVIYITREKDDALSIAKFLRENVNQIMKDYKDQILEARAALVRDAVEGKKPDGDA